MKTRKTMTWSQMLFSAVLVLFMFFAFTSCKNNTTDDDDDYSDDPGTPGLLYKLDATGKGYEVSMGTADAKEIIIASRYEGKPVREIANSGFYSNKNANARNITSVIIPNSVTIIREDAFLLCHYLTSITISNKIETIERGAFGFCNRLESITIPGSINFIDSEVFEFCIDLTSVTINAKDPPKLGKETSTRKGVFDNTHARMQIKVPSGSVDKYKAAEGWSTYADKIVAQ